MRVSFLIIAFVVAITLSSTHETIAAPPVQVLADEADAAQAEDDVTVGTSTWTIDNRYTSLVCAASHYGLSFIYGRFNSCSGDVEINFDESDETTFRFEIDPDSIDTNDAARDIQLRGESCLDAGQYGSISFESSKVETDDEEIAGKTKRTYRVTGNLNMHGETRRITIPINLLSVGNGPDGKLRCGFISRFVINRSDFGLDGLPDQIGDSVAVTFCFQCVRQPNPQPVRQQPEKQPEPKPEEDTDEEDTEEEPALVKTPEIPAADPFEDSKPEETEDSPAIVEQRRLEDLFIPSSSPSGENDIAPDAEELPTGLDRP